MTHHSKLKNNLLYIVISILTIFLIFFVYRTNVLETNLSINEQKLNRDVFIKSQILGNNLFELNKLSDSIKLVETNNKRLFLIGSLSNCSNCLVEILNNISRNKLKDSLFYVLDLNGEDEFLKIKLDYGLNNLFWDKNLNLSEIIGIDIRKINPFILTVSSGLIINMFELEINNLSQIENEYKRINKF